VGSVSDSGVVVVTGATGRQGGAVTRALLRDGRRVRALTRKPGGPAARALAAAGADVFASDMDDPDSLDRAFAGADGVYSVQNFMTSGLDGEIRQGRNVGEAAVRAGVRHLVYGSAGVGRRGTGVGSWESKLHVEDHLRGLGLPMTVLRPMAFMELMTDRAFYPAAGVWHVWPKVAGWDFQVPWLSCHDLGVIAAKAFADPQGYIGRDLKLAAEVRSLKECRSTYARVMGREPRRFPMPLGLFQRFSPDTVRMWEWCRKNDLDTDRDLVRSLHPEAMTVEMWLRSRKTVPRPV
jgi:uncharacterized protein YbjT (DUF2867 family)